MGYKTKSMINQASGIDAFSLLNKEAKKIGVSSAIPKSGFGSGKLNKGFNVGYNSKNLSSNSESTNISKEKPSKKLSDRAFKKQAKSIGTYINEGGETGYKKSQRKEAREVGREAAKDIDTSFKKAELAGTDFNSLLIGTIQNISASSKASSKKRKVKRAARKEHKEFQKKGSSSLDGKGLKEGFKGADLPKIDSGIKTGDFFQNTFNKFNPDRDKSIKKQAKDKETIKRDTSVSKSIEDAKSELKKQTPGISGTQGRVETQIVVPGSDTPDSKYNISEFGKNFTRQDEANKAAAENKKMDYFKELGMTDSSEGLPVINIQDDKNKTLGGVQMLGDGFNKGMLRKNKYKK